MNGSIFKTVKAVLVTPANFYAGMPVTGGFVQPVLFVVIIALVTALLLALAELFVAGFASALTQLLQGLVALPVYGLLVCLGLSVLFYLSGSLLESGQSFETAFRCSAYSFAVFPLWMLVQGQHEILQIVVLAFWAVILSSAAEVVIKVKPLLARAVLAVLVALVSVYLLCRDCYSESDQQLPDAAGLSEPAAIDMSSAPYNDPDAGAGVDLSIGSRSVGTSADGNIQPEALAAGNEPAQDDSPEAGAEEALSAEKAGEKLGEMVREVSETVSSVSEDFLKGFDQAVDADVPEKKLTPEQLGANLGAFIRDVSSVLREAEQDIETDLREQASDINSKAELSVEKARKAVEDFVSAFNRALETEAETEPETGVREESN